MQFSLLVHNNVLKKKKKLGKAIASRNEAREEKRREEKRREEKRREEKRREEKRREEEKGGAEERRNTTGNTYTT